jgi:hypothetical protein
MKLTPLPYARLAPRRDSKGSLIVKTLGGLSAGYEYELSTVGTVWINPHYIVAIQAHHQHPAASVLTLGVSEGEESMSYIIPLADEALVQRIPLEE